MAKQRKLIPVNSITGKVIKRPDLLDDSDATPKPGMEREWLSIIGNKQRRQTNK